MPAANSAVGYRLNLPILVEISSFNVLKRFFFNFRSWIDLNNTKNTPPMTSSASFSFGSETQGGAAAMFDIPMVSPLNSYMRNSAHDSYPRMQRTVTPAYDSAPRMQRIPTPLLDSAPRMQRIPTPLLDSVPRMQMIQAPTTVYEATFTNNDFASQNSIYPPNAAVSDHLRFSENAYYANASSALMIGQSRSYNSFASTNQGPEINGINLSSNSTDQMPNINFSSNPSQMFLSNSINFGKPDSSIVNESATLRTSYSTPTFTDQQNSQEAVPMDLSNPYSSQFTGTPGSSLGSTPQNSFDDESGGIDLSLPPFNW